ncbi:sigma-70 family RNA polymerase sigma factor [Hanstruepera neustonica]|uniref:Sigma-70 family RNA polymerase sigma factor n=1 Tax=Hanstruepera neustonica TaxID=1445657 RepID=A0A2K1DXM5_9FLAO|nr:sigma-70 family RNA polymerase sigma factor [Hanstruepera neustonica]PNQ72786.1 sigma-70 family RNA polymerase sigma factor [Hanstruepera neustonica]
MNRHTEELFTKIKQGDSKVLEAIYLDNRLAFLNFGLKYNLNKEALLDIYQDAIIAFVENVTNGKIISLSSSVKTYLFSIGKYMIFKKLKKESKLEALDLDDKRLELSIKLIDSIYDESNVENNKLIKQCLNKLGQQCQTVLKLFYYNGFTLEEIQEHLNYGNYNTVKSQKSRCLKNLKELINEQLKNE